MKMGKMGGMGGMDMGSESQGTDKMDMKMDDDMDSDSMMSTYFQFTSTIPHLLLESFAITSLTSYFITCFLLFAFCVFKEYIFYYRLHLIASHRRFPSLEFSHFPFLTDRVLGCLIYGINLCFSYFIMLVVMTFNAGLFIVIIVGSTVGHYLFAGSVEGMKSETTSEENGLENRANGKNGKSPEKERLTGKRNSDMPLLSSNNNNSRVGGGTNGGSGGGGSNPKRLNSAPSEDDLSDIEAELAVDCCER